MHVKVKTDKNYCQGTAQVQKNLSTRKQQNMCFKLPSNKDLLNIQVLINNCTIHILQRLVIHLTFL